MQDDGLICLILAVREVESTTALAPCQIVDLDELLEDSGSNVPNRQGATQSRSSENDLEEGEDVFSPSSLGDNAWNTKHSRQQVMTSLTL